MAQFSPAKSTVSAQNLMEFMDKPIHTLMMKDIPGIGPATVEKLSSDGIKSVQQLIAKFLMFCTTESDTNSVCQCFFNWLNSVSPGGHVHTVTFSIANIVDNYGIYKYEYTSNES